MTDLITVIVPIYNAEKSIAQCVDSILAQKYCNLEVLLINDGSTDNSLAKCYEYANKDKRVRVMDKPNSGVSDTRNLGIMNAKGDYIAFVDADDRVDSEMYSKMHQQAVLTSADLLFCYFYEEINGITCKKNERALKRVVYGKDLRPMFSTKNNVMGSVWRILIKSSLCKTLSFNEKVKLEEDKLFVLEAIAKAEKMAIVEDFLYYYKLNVSVNKYYSDNLFEEKKYLYFCESKFFDCLPIGAVKAEKYRIYLKTAMSVLYNSNDYQQDMKRLRNDTFFKEAQKWVYLKNYIANESMRNGIKAILLKLGMYKLLKSIITRSKM